RLVGGTPMPYSLTVRYHATTPVSSPACKVALSQKLVSTEVNEGETVDLRVELANKSAEGIPMTMAILGLPGGLESRADQLKELVKEGKIDFFETRGRDVILYKRGMAPHETASVVLNLVAAIPGTYRGAASRAYLYYTDEDKHWVDPLVVHVKARETDARSK
ncbi:A-macroglobulin complement component, partial [bacterium]|nr:A-macroglobulin complement component [bacterium]